MRFLLNCIENNLQICLYDQLTAFLQFYQEVHHDNLSNFTLELKSEAIKYYYSCFSYLKNPNVPNFCQFITSVRYLLCFAVVLNLAISSKVVIVLLLLDPNARSIWIFRDQPQLCLE